VISITTGHLFCPTIAVLILKNFECSAVVI